jgi:CDP-glucose 4,6-dehydratase
MQDSLIGDGLHLAYSKHMRVLITGHTGFKGSWLSLMLAKLGNEIHGISDRIVPNSHFELAEVENVMSSSRFLDIRDKVELTNAIDEVHPDIVVHLAAQAFVLESYRLPFATFETNVMGTINLLEACEVSKVKRLLVITSDKVYKVGESKRPFIESDPLGGVDPYSSSKAAADLATQSLSQGFASTRVSIVRAGNVIGGGDFGLDRLIPDLVRAQSKSELAIIRRPNAIRPWQHVLDCLDAYIKIIDFMFYSDSAGIWNVGPDSNPLLTVREIADRFSQLFGNDTLWKTDEIAQSQFKETEVLSLDSRKIREELGWIPKLNEEDSMRWTFQWYKGMFSNANPAELTSIQIDQYLAM